MGFTKLFSDIVESSIWQESPEICKVWITMLALADSEGFIRGSEGWLAMRCKLDIKIIDEAIKRFAKPDIHSRTPTNDGKRIEKTPDGWVILNYVFYREQTGRELAQDHRRTYQREWMQKYRNEQSEREVAKEINKNGNGRIGKAFEEFWSLYPRKVGKACAFRSFKIHKCSEVMETIKKAISEQLVSDQWQKDGGQFIPHPTTWLNQERWLDEGVKVMKRRSLLDE